MPVILQAGWPPINARQPLYQRHKTSRGVKGTAGTADGTRLDSKERKWESKRGYGLHIIHW